MTPDVAKLISRLEESTRRLLNQHAKLQQQLIETEQKNSELKQQNLALVQEKKELEDKCARLSMARLIDMADDDELRTTRKRINKMIASVDKCLAALRIEQ